MRGSSRRARICCAAAWARSARGTRSEPPRSGRRCRSGVRAQSRPDEPEATASSQHHRPPSSQRPGTGSRSDTAPADGWPVPGLGLTSRGEASEAIGGLSGLFDGLLDVYQGALQLESLPAEFAALVGVLVIVGINQTMQLCQAPLDPGELQAREDLLRGRLGSKREGNSVGATEIRAALQEWRQGSIPPRRARSHGQLPAPSPTVQSAPRNGLSERHRAGGRVACARPWSHLPGRGKRSNRRVIRTF